MTKQKLKTYLSEQHKTIDYSHGTSAHAHEALLIHLHKLCAYQLYLCHCGVAETNKLSKEFKKFRESNITVVYAVLFTHLQKTIFAYFEIHVVHYIPVVLI